MKTSEFIEYFNTKGYIAFNHYGDIVFEDPRGNEVLEIDSENNVYTAFYDLPFSKQQEYYKVIFEYLMTPIEERKEEKKYQLRQIGVHDRYLIWLSELEFWTTGSSYHDDIKTVFTQSEIDELPECYKHPAVWEQVEVESEEEC